MRLLLVFPGVSSPYHPQYIPVYDLLRKECANRGVEIRVLQYPGQEGQDGVVNAETSPESSIDYALKVLDDFEQKSIPYTTLGISYGCNISMAASLRAKSTSGWQRAIAWAPIPHWKVWASFGQSRQDDTLAKGTSICKPHTFFYSQSIPNEYLIQHAPVHLTVAAGSNDRHVGNDYLLYLRSLCREVREQRKFSFIEGCQHNVVAEDPGVDKYINLIFE